MATKFGYVRKEATNQLDWGAIATQFTSILSEEGKARTAKKAAIDKASREMAETLENAPSGQYRDGNKFTADYTADAQQLLLTQDRLLKQGILKPRDYAVVRANLNSSNKSMFKLGEAYQEAYKVKMERMNSSDPATRSQLLESWQMEQAEGLYNLKNSKALINPSNGMVSIGLWKDGSMETDPNSFQTVPQLMGNLAGEYNYYDVRDAVNTATTDLGMIDEVTVALSGYQGGLDQLIKTSSQGGKYSKNNEILKEYNEWTSYTADAMMANPFNVTSILTNENLKASNGEQYTFTKETDPKKRKANEIFLNTDLDMGGMPEFTDEQSKKVKDAIIQRLNDSVDKKITASGSRVPFDNASRNKAEGNKQNQNTYSMLGDMYYGDGNAVKAAEQYFRDLLGADTVVKKGNVIYVTKNGITKPVSMLDAENNMMDFNTFAESAVLLTGVSNIKDSVDLAGGIRRGEVTDIETTDKENEYTVTYKDGRVETKTGDITKSPYTVGEVYEYTSITPTGGGATTVGTESAQSYGQKYINNVITLENVLTQTENGVTSNITDDEYVETKLKPFIEAFGFEINNPVSIIGTNYLEIMRPDPKDGETPHYFYTDKGEDAMQQELIDLRTYLNSNLKDELINGNMEFIQSQIGPLDTGTGSDKPTAY